MKTKINQTEARSIWNKYLKTKYLRFHTLESEAIMRKLAKHFDKDEEFWGITGLLHDLDTFLQISIDAMIEIADEIGM